MYSVADKIMAKIRQHGPGYIFTPKRFVHYGTRVAVDTALSRLVANGDIRRLTRGVYDYPQKHHLLGLLTPSLDDIARVIAEDAGSDLQISGARALHLLGLTTQVPAQTIYFVSCSSRKIKIGSVTLTLKHAGSRVMFGAGKKVGVVLQAIRHLGEAHLSDDILGIIASHLSLDEKNDLRRAARHTPSWVKPAIDKITGA